MVSGFPLKSKEERKNVVEPLMSKIVRPRNKGTIFQPSWNENGLPIGKDSVTLMSYWGTIIRKNIPITIDEWKQDPQLLLDKLFEDDVVTYKVHPKKKKFMMTKANIAWRNFKSMLSRLWIWDPKGVVHEKPPDKYNFIKLTDWKTFVKARLTKKWEKKSKATKKSAEPNLYPQKRSRRGYARYE